MGIDFGEFPMSFTSAPPALALGSTHLVYPSKTSRGATLRSATRGLHKEITAFFPHHNIKKLVKTMTWSMKMHPNWSKLIQNMVYMFSKEFQEQFKDHCLRCLVITCGVKVLLRTFQKDWTFASLTKFTLRWLNSGIWGLNYQYVGIQWV